MGIEGDRLSQSVLEAYQKLAWEDLRQVPIFPPLPSDYVPPSKWTIRRRKLRMWWRWKRLRSYRLHAAGECPRDDWA